MSKPRHDAAARSRLRPIAHRAIPDIVPALKQAVDRWGRCAVVRLELCGLYREPLCEVGVKDHSETNIHGIGGSWDAAFRDADAREKDQR